MSVGLLVEVCLWGRVCVCAESENEKTSWRRRNECVPNFGYPLSHVEPHTSNQIDKLLFPFRSHSFRSQMPLCIVFQFFVQVQCIFVSPTILSSSFGYTPSSSHAIHRPPAAWNVQVIVINSLSVFLRVRSNNLLCASLFRVPFIILASEKRRKTKARKKRKLKCKKYFVAVGPRSKLRKMHF